jgi:hypothetical protein
MPNKPIRNPDKEMVNDLAAGYERMLERIRTRLAQAEANAPLPVYMAIEEAREQAVALGEMTQTEAHEVAEWLKRDLLHLRDLIERAERGARSWLGMDLALIERGLLEILADPTRVDWLRLQEEFESLRRSSVTPAQKQQQAKPGKAQDP